MTAAVHRARATARARPQRVEPRPGPLPGALPGWRPEAPPLRVVPRGPARRARRRRGRLLLATAAVLVVVGMFAVVGAHVLLAQRQFRLDTMTQELAQEQARHDDLTLRVAHLEAPSRIVTAAEQRLHMVVPPAVVYLVPGAHPSTKVKGVAASQAGSGGQLQSPAGSGGTVAGAP